MASPRRERLLDTAEQLFYREGFHAIGIDRIQAESGVAKTTLYKHFRSKDALILAVLERTAARVQEKLLALVEPLHGQGSRRVTCLFDELHHICEAPDFNGCLFSNAAAEFMYLNAAIRQCVSEHLTWLEALFARLLQEEGLPSSRAAMLLALYQGVLSTARVKQAPELVDQASALVAELLEGE
ncbi:MAG: TetR/AcrR family transcriptional regulator [Pseudomonadota bacterium]